MSARRLPCLLAAALTGWLTHGARAGGCGTVVLPAGFGQSDPQAITSLSPLLSNSIYNNQIIYQLYRPLVWLDRNVRYDPIASLASGLGTTDGGRTYRLTLKPWLWSDGVPVTADDVVFTFDLIRRIGPGFTFYKVGGIPDLIERVSALSPHEVEIRLTKRVNPEWFLGLGLGNTIKPLPAHVYRGLGLREIRARQTDPTLFAVSDGPFLLADFQVGRHLTLVPNPLYGGQHPHIRRLVIDFLEGGNPLQALRSGETDGAQVPYRLWDLARGLPGMRVQTLDGPFGYAAMILNFRSRHAPFLRDQAVREAITLGIDQEQVIALAEHGQGRVIHGPVPVAMTGFLSPRARAGYAALDHDPARAGMVEHVGDLVGTPAQVDRDADDAELGAREVGDEELGTVAGDERQHVTAGVGELVQPVRDAVPPGVELGVGPAPVAVDERDGARQPSGRARQRIADVDAGDEIGGELRLHPLTLARPTGRGQ